MSLPFLGPLLLLLALDGVAAENCSCKKPPPKSDDVAPPVHEVCSLFPSIIQELSEIKGMLRDALKQTRELNLGTSSAGLNCNEIPGSLIQIDSGNGHVVGVNANDNIYTLYQDSWTRIPGALKHVTVGAAGFWGVNRNNNIYKIVGGSWVKVSGLLKQIDAGGSQFVSGANMNDDIYCLGHSDTVAVKDGSSLPWKHLDGKLKYYSCGPKGCWGVNSADDIYFRHSVTAHSCAGSRWQHVDDKLSMIEVGSDDSVYGVNSVGNLYRRDGINPGNPAGTTWTQLGYNSLKFRHVSQDLGWLWLITVDQKILKCQL